jgi:hypothetical protein
MVITAALLPPLLLLAAAAMAKPVVTVVESYAKPVISRGDAAAAGVLGGFETGNAIKLNGTYHLFYGERSPPTTYPWKMGWTTRVGHWTSRNRLDWHRLETVIDEGMWSTMPWYDTAAARWKIFYCNETDRTTRTAVAANSGRDSIERSQSWSWSEEQPSMPTYSISNPFRVQVRGRGQWQVFLDHRMFAVSLAVADTAAGPYVLQPNSNTALIRRTQPGNRSWIENPVVSAVTRHAHRGDEGQWDGTQQQYYAAMFDWVQGGGQKPGTPLPYLGFSYSTDGINWPDTHGELVSVTPASGATIWTDLVRTPTALIPEEDGTFTLFYAARDTSNASSRTGNATQPYTNCSVEPATTVPPSRRRGGEAGAAAAGAGAPATSSQEVPRAGGTSAPPPPPPGWGNGCFWGMGMLRVRLDFPPSG